MRSEDRRPGVGDEQQQQVLRRHRGRSLEGQERGATRQLLGPAVAFYVVSRLCVLVGSALVATQQATLQSGRVGAEVVNLSDGGTSLTRRVLAILTSWDGQWYLTVTRYGYPSHVPSPVTGLMLESRAAFFPAFPYLVRAIDTVLPGGAATAAVLVNILLGFSAVYLVGLLALRLYDVRTARVAMLFFAVFPGSFVLSFAYSEALFVTLAAGVLILLLDERWVLAGVLAALASATRPTGLALTVACAVAVYLAWRDRRTKRAVIAPLLAASGFVGTIAVIGIRSGELGVWFRVQREAWDEDISFGVSSVSASWDALVHPFESPHSLLTLLALALAAGLIVASVRIRLPSTELAYSLAVIVLMLLPETVSARPRFLLPAFPLFIGAAAFATTRVRGRRWLSSEPGMLIVGLSCAALTAMTALYGSGAAVP